ncbi:hypothetical protein LIA77_00294 [Sarocladium implicatum]|nr:hypothetical protein LIA77_00294 [Sarocladium implicatum]
METDRRSRYDRSRSVSAARDRSRSRPRALSFSRSPSPRGRDTRRSRAASFSSLSSSSRSRSRRRKRSRSRQKTKPEKKPEENKGALAALKSAAPLLATIGVASVVAHKFWPKGVLFGDKEEWETRPVKELHSRTVIRDEEGRVHRARTVREREGGPLVVDDVVRKNGRRDRSVDERFVRAEAQLERRPASAFYEDERRYARPPPPPLEHHRRDDRAYLDDRHQPRYSERYDETRYDDDRYADRAYRPSRYTDDRGYDDRGPRW